MSHNYYKEVTKLLQKNGYARRGRGRGPHQKWSNKETQHSQSVPFPLKSLQTANGILKAAGINYKIGSANQKEKSKKPKK